MLSPQEQIVDSARNAAADAGVRAGLGSRSSYAIAIQQYEASLWQDPMTSVPEVGVVVWAIWGQDEPVLLARQQPASEGGAWETHGILRDPPVRWRYRPLPPTIPLING